MPFIWDDEVYLLEEEEYYENRFVIARKLFVTPNTSSNEKSNVNGFNEETLNEYFRKFGDIESIEIFKPKEQEAEETTKSETFAYVTFRSDISAHAAMEDYDHQIQKYVEYNVLPADTWKQPSQQNSTVESMVFDEEEVCVPPIFMLNEDCFEMLFRYLDVQSQKNLREVCKSLNTLVCEHGFKQVKSLKYSSGHSREITLAQIRGKVKCVGKHIKQLDFDSVGDQYCQRSLDILCKYIGKKLRSASFNVSKVYFVFNIVPLPLLENLTSLLITASNNCIFDFDVFQTVSPNLTKLELYANYAVLRGGKTWPKLKSLSFGNRFLNSNLGTFCEFLKQNPQITTLKLMAASADNILQTVATHLPNLEELYIHQRYTRSEISCDMLRSLVASNSLTKLSLINNTGSFNDILVSIEFSSLRELKYISFHGEDVGSSTQTQTQQSIIHFAKHSPHLEKIYLDSIELQRCPSVVLNFIRFARNLKEIHIHHSKLNITQEFATKIVEELKSSRPRYFVPLKLFVCERYADDLEHVKKLDTVPDYLHIEIVPFQWRT